MAERKRSDVTKFLEANPDMGLDTGQPAPGQSHNERAYVPDLGYIDEFTDPAAEQVAFGPAFVVLSDFISTPDGVGRKKGFVVRLSEIDGRYADDKRREREMDAIKLNVKRLIEGGSIRVADDEEAQLERIDVIPENESPAVRRERERRMQMERLLKEHGIDPNAPVAAKDEDEETEDEE
jgi:hypothetical protein